MSTDICYNPFVSVILPVYNGEKYLEDAIKSVLDQTYTNFELIIVDNASSDSTSTIINKYSSIDSRVMATYCEKRGIVCALNWGINQSKGTLIARIDSDDFWRKDKLSLQVSALNQSPSVALVGTSTIIVDEDGKEKNDVEAFNNGQAMSWQDIKANLSKRNLFCHSSVVFRKQPYFEVGGYIDEFDYSEDFDLWCRIVRSFEAIILSEKLTFYRDHKLNLSKEFFVKQQISSFRVKAKYVFLIGNYAQNCYRITISFFKLIRLIIGKTLQRVVKAFKIC